MVRAVHEPEVITTAWPVIQQFLQRTSTLVSMLTSRPQRGARHAVLLHAQLQALPFKLTATLLRRVWVRE